MKKIVTLALIVSLLNVIPANSYAAENAAGATTPPVQAPAGKHVPGLAGTSTTTQVGIVAIAVSVLGLIALAASSDSGDATPATTNHPR